MPKRKSRILVVDANIMQAAGGTDATDNVSISCRDLLLEILEICHRVVKTPEIKTEWKKHSSGYALKWEVKMWGCKKIIQQEELEDKQLREKVSSLNYRERIIKTMQKDIHLIEAARKNHKIISSLEKESQKYFSGSAHKVRKLKGVMWVNPSEDFESVKEWLKAGAKDNDIYRLENLPNKIEPPN